MLVSFKTVQWMPHPDVDVNNKSDINNKSNTMIKLTYPTDLMLMGKTRMTRVVKSLNNTIDNVIFAHHCVDDFNGKLIVLIADEDATDEDIFQLGITVGIAMMVK